MVFAGRNDNLKSPYLNDLYILTLDSLTWIKVNMFILLFKIEILGTMPKPRAGHSAISYDSKMVVLGGLNLEGYLPN
jgi:hypothetical protein